MFEVRNLTKIYRPKSGAEVKALDDVSLFFEETGMVFLLGKSGSGKSTLLNICGGLDAPTEGEIIVKGRSSKDFTQSDFDSYRNTFVGFVFQEYNILNEFSVEDNIALALELQNKPKDKAAIKKILADVDLEGIQNRKPNTLSGGQKQRIAIARALIKDPKIIMADEPSGALDSVTGKQVFDTLKSLSKDRLVIVVSHDRDFAEQYGDRIIELKDGRVISDVSKNSEKQKPVTKNIDAMENILRVRGGAELDKADLEEIKAFLSRAEDDVIITSGKKEVSGFKAANRINENGEREVFKETTAKPSKAYQPEDCRFISSRLPLKHAIKIGLSGLKSKPVRLFFTSLLCIASFIIFGLLSTMSLYNSGAIFKKSMANSNQSVIRVKKEYEVDIQSYQNEKPYLSYKEVYKTDFTPEELEKLKDTYGRKAFGGVETDSTFVVYNSQHAFWMNRIDFVAFVPKDNVICRTIKGDYPENDNEVCISSYTADVLFNCKTYDENRRIINFTKPEDVIGKTIHILGRLYTITGIFDSGEIDEKYNILKSEADKTELEQLVNSFETTLEDGLHFVAFSTENAVRTIAAERAENHQQAHDYRALVSVVDFYGISKLPEYANSYYAGVSEKAEGVEFYELSDEIKTLEEGEVVIHEDLFYESVERIYTAKQIFEKDSKKHQKYVKISNLCREQKSGGSWNYGNVSGFTAFTEEQLEENIQTILAALKEDGIELNLKTVLFDDKTYDELSDVMNMRIVGFWTGGPMAAEEKTVYIADDYAAKLWKTHKGGLLFSEEADTKFVRNFEAFYSDIFLPYDHSKEQTEVYGDIYTDASFDNKDCRIALSGAFIENLAEVDYSIQEMSKIFLGVGIALALFAALLLSNFISVSITQKKKEIGILRAVGAKGTDVFKMFFSESAVIVIICIIISSIASIIGCNIINEALAQNVGAELLVFGVPSFILLVLVAVTTAVLATFLPVYNAAKKRPIDSIRSN